jgi:hypothetical protein
MGRVRLSTAEGPRRATQRVAQRLGARRTSEERGIADHDGAQKHEERCRGKEAERGGAKRGRRACLKTFNSQAGGLALQGAADRFRGLYVIVDNFCP